MKNIHARRSVRLYRSLNLVFDFPARRQTKNASKNKHLNTIPRFKDSCVEYRQNWSMTMPAFASYRQKLDKVPAVFRSSSSRRKRPVPDQTPYKEKYDRLGEPTS